MSLTRNDMIVGCRKEGPRAIAPGRGLDYDSPSSAALGKVKNLSRKSTFSSVHQASALLL
ncbi:hypothetical protein PG984_003104 [Apiospora sp. TS-2023a]